jgi:hypothetical protein
MPTKPTLSEEEILQLWGQKVHWGHEIPRDAMLQFVEFAFAVIAAYEAKRHPGVDPVPAHAEKIAAANNFSKKGDWMPKTEKRKIVRTYSSGVFFAEIVKRNGKEATLKNARRLWYWRGAASLSQLAQSGTSDPKGCKFPEPVTEIIVTEVIEILSVTEAAAATIDAVPIWKS